MQTSMSDTILVRPHNTQLSESCISMSDLSRVVVCAEPILPSRSQ